MSARLAALVLAEAEIEHRLSLESDTMRELRPGQAAFNAVNHIAPEVADQIRGTAVDPYFDDRRLSAFYAALSRAAFK